MITYYVCCQYNSELDYMVLQLLCHCNYHATDIVFFKESSCCHAVPSAILLYLIFHRTKVSGV